MVKRHQPPPERYIALGDSYTIGEGVDPDRSWPNLLVTHLRHCGINIELVANPSVSGWTTKEVIAHELPIFEASRPTFATLLIGVNDWVQSISKREFRENLAHILDRTQATLPDRNKVLLITIPDFSVTPDGPTYARGRDIAEGIAAFNDIIKAEADLRELPVVDIFPLSQDLGDARFIGEDNLHPSANAYIRWEKLIFPAARELLA